MLVLLVHAFGHAGAVEQAGIDFWVHVRPGGRRDAVEGIHDGVLAIRVVAPPTEGRANRSVCRVIADSFGVARIDVKVVGGRTGKRKLIRVHGDHDLLRARLEELLGVPPAPPDSENGVGPARGSTA